MRTLIATSLFVVGAGLAVAADPPKPPSSVEEKKAGGALEGAYTIVSGERDGKAIPESEIKGALVRFTLGQVEGTDKDRKVLFAATYALDTSKKPWRITMKSVAPKKASTSGIEETDGVTAVGLVKKDGEMLTIIYALPGGEKPTEFKTKAKQNMFVMKNFLADPVGPNKFAPPKP